MTDEFTIEKLREACKVLQENTLDIGPFEVVLCNRELLKRMEEEGWRPGDSIVVDGMEFKPRVVKNPFKTPLDSDSDDG